MKDAATTFEATALYRITHKRYADDPFSGTGGLYYRSRWASKGRRVSYAADHLALAALEKIAGVRRADLLSEMVYAVACVPATHVTALHDDERPPDWDALPARDATRHLGDAWLEAGEHLILRVPSVILSHSFNYVINADHPAIAALTVTEVTPLLLDNRVLRQLGLATS